MKGPGLVVTIILSLILLIHNGGTSFEQNDWGLKVIELQKQVELLDTLHLVEFTFAPMVSSNKFEFRLYFPDSNYGDLDFNAQRGLRRSIISSLNGLVFEILEGINMQIIADYRIRIGEKGFKYAFNDNKPLSLWIKSGVHLESGKNYFIRLTLPPRRQTEARLAKPIFVVGIGKDVHP